MVFLATSWIQNHNPTTNFKVSVAHTSQINQPSDQLLIALFDFIPPNTPENQSQIRVEKGKVCIDFMCLRCLP